MIASTNFHRCLFPQSIAIAIGLVCGCSAWVSAADPARQPSEQWPTLPKTDDTVEIPAQEWPARPGPRTVRAQIYYPRGELANVTNKTGLMLTLHNWGGEHCVGTASPRTLADRLNVIALCVNYLQSGPKDSIEGPEPYDHGYLQALDALRSLWLVRQRLIEQRQPFDDGRIFATGGSGGGNVALMANKLAPRTFVGVVDLCGMKKLSADVAFNLPGGSELNARWSRNPESRAWLSSDAQDLRFLAHPEHLTVMRELGNQAKVIVVHGVDDTTCPIREAQELVEAMRKAKLAIEPHYVDRARVDQARVEERVFTGTGHTLGDRTQIVLQVAEHYLATGGAQSLRREGRTDFEHGDELVRYRTSAGEFVVSYRDGFPVGRFEPDSKPVAYHDHHDVLHVIDSNGERQAVRSLDDWQVRRQHILANWQLVAGVMPGAAFKVPLDVHVTDEGRVGSITRRKLSFQSDPFDRVPAWLLIPEHEPGMKLPAMLCLHQTTPQGKDETVGLAGRESMHYGLELAQRGYIVLCPDYPSFGEYAYEFASNPEYVSGTLKAVWDNRRAVDLLTSMAEVDAERIGVIGHSLGGHNAIFTAMWEPRLKVIVSSCGFTRLDRDDLPSWSGPRYMPRIVSQFKNDRLQLPFDFPELVATLAPRPFFACAATQDDDFDVRGVREVIAEAGKVYKLFESPQKLQADYPQGPHEFPEAARKRAYEFIDQHLRAK